jgi:predicted membrane chloride channel (bestrophin family)
MARQLSTKSLIFSLRLIINYKTLVVTALSVSATYLCFRYHIVGDFPLTIVGIAIVFPVVFSIDSAYKRRERALENLADFKAHAVSTYLSFKDWIPGNNPSLPQNLKDKVVALYEGVVKVFVHGKDASKDFESEVYPRITDLSAAVQEFRQTGVAATEMSRVNQYLSRMIHSLENLRIILEYRTPSSLRAYGKVFIFSFPILYAPYFVYLSESFTEGLEYFVPVVFSFILVSLANIQDHLENPFDQLGEDDIHFRVDEFKAMLR